MNQVFPTVGRFSRGYDRLQVDDFFTHARKAYEGGVRATEFSAEQVRQATFDSVRGGYSTTDVDHALDRLEAAFIKRDRSDHVAVNGKQAWLDWVAERATSLYPRLLREPGMRFAHPEGRKLGYRCEDVDDFLDCLVEFFDEGGDLTAKEVRAVTFRPARGKKAYAPGPVDAYLGRAGEVLLAVE